MAEALKEMYSRDFFAVFVKELQMFIPDLNKSLFLQQIYDDAWEIRELKDRMHHVALVLKEHLPSDYKKAVVLIKKLICLLKQKESNMAFPYIFLADFIEQFGQDEYEVSVQAMEHITQFISCEFAVRPFIIRYPEQMMQQMLLWSEHEHHYVRRFASEGCRPRLPWAMALPALKKDPSAILTILNNLKNDASEFVRKSVANNLNDISKDHPELVIKLAKEWKGKTTHTDWILKHGCRTLLKQGNEAVLQLFGVGEVQGVFVKELGIQTPKVKIGDALEFSFQVHNENAAKVNLRLEYGLYYRKANGSLSRKVFKISEKEYKANSVTSIERKQSFRIITTRKFHIGEHQLTVIVNGKESERHGFLLIA